MCVYDSCPYNCLTKYIHHSKFARIRRNNSYEIKNEIKKEVKKDLIEIKSPKVNWDIVNEFFPQTIKTKKI